MTHKCIKPTCSNVYEDDDTEAYYCPDCKETNKQIAEEIDSKLKSAAHPKVMSMLDEYNAQPKGKYGFPIYRP